MTKLATNFEENFLSKINELLKFVLENEHSDFYRKKYDNASFYPLKSYEDFQKIPFLTKEDILEVPVLDRCFLPQDQVAYFSFSSGTTKRPVPTIVPHASFYHNLMSENLIPKDQLKELGVTKMLLLVNPSSPLNSTLLALQHPPVVFVRGDVKNLKLSASIIEQLSIEGIMTTPTILDFLIEEMQSCSLDLAKIKWISLGSEFCSIAQLKYFRAQFPNAFFMMRYATSEIGGMRYYRCKHLAQGNLPNVFHVAPGSELMEIVSSNGEPLPLGEIGEIVHTDLESKAFPLIRYRLKDMGSLQKKSCPCGNDLLFTIEGKEEYDVLRVHGITIHAELVSQAMTTIQDIAESRYQLHVHEVLLNGKPKLKLELHLKLRSQYADEKNNFIIIEMLKEKISSHLQLSANMTLKQLVEQGSFLPLEIVFVANWMQDSAKTKNIISHLK